MDFNEFDENVVSDEETENTHAPEPEAMPQEPASADQESQPYHQAGVGRKESPFADSPYVMEHEPVFKPGYTVPPADKKPKTQKKRGNVLRRVVAAILIVALVGGSCGLTAHLVNSRWEKETEKLAADMTQKIGQLQTQLDALNKPEGEPGQIVTPDNKTMLDGLTPAQVYSQNLESVVLIYNEMTVNQGFQSGTATSTGSGFILTVDGYVVTNYHVVEDAGTLSVITYEGTEHPATLIGYDQTNDVALLKIEGTNFNPVTVGSSEALTVGEQVAAIGNPLGELTSTLTVGYVSAKDRDVTTDGTTINMIQTDVAINSGNSGGPLFNMQGEVVGITTAKYSGTSSSGATIEGIGFAIPIDDVIGMLEDIMNYGYVTGAYLGVSVYSVDASDAAMYNFPLGSLVDSVVEGSCAQKAGVQPKDIIIVLGGIPVENNTDLTRALRKFKAGETTTITVWRSGQQLDLTITLDEKPQQTTTQTTPGQKDPDTMPSEGSFDEWYDWFFGDKGN